MLRKPPTRIEMKLEEGLLKEHAEMIERTGEKPRARPNALLKNDPRSTNDRIGIITKHSTNQMYYVIY